MSAMTCTPSEEYVNGKQKRVPREPLIDGLSVDEFIRCNADPIWLLQEGYYEDLDTCEERLERLPDDLPALESEEPTLFGSSTFDGDLPF